MNFVAVLLVLLIVVHLSSMQAEAKFYRKLEEDRVQCLLCPHSCVIEPGRTGKCNVRRNLKGTLYTATYGAVSGISVDPIEKKPLYHFLPGTGVLSIGSVGCTMTCLYCQNDHISQCLNGDAERLEKVSPGRVVETTLDREVPSIAFTYNEPVVSYEFIRDVAGLARDHDLRNVMVSNGYIQPRPMKELLPLLDAVNIDLKAFDDAVYQDVCGARLSHVLRTLELIAESDTLLEITYLVVTGLNDDPALFEKMVSSIRERFGPDQVLHISRYFPRYRMNAPSTPLATMGKMIELAKERLNYVYAGNTGTELDSDTYCPSCGQHLVGRHQYTTRITGLDQNRCSNCKTEIHGKFD